MVHVSRSRIGPHFAIRDHWDVRVLTPLLDDERCSASASSLASPATSSPKILDSDSIPRSIQILRADVRCVVLHIHTG